jgi:3-hydroxyacyl-CoA dehydrogenase/enoyl-CoA hydratase/3-hydroxybutyryl-CoA epimerase
MPSHSQHWRLETDAERIAWLTFDLQGSSTNTLGSAPMRELNDRIAEIEAAQPRAVILRSAKENGFVAGADISEFGGLKDLEQSYRLVRSGQQVFDRLAALPMPTVAAIHGFALGGGLELALACDYRVGADDGKLSLGLPEVMLGVHPGFGGTVRTPQLIGVPAALDLMLTGRSLRAEEARKLGLVDRLSTRDGLASAAREIAVAPPPRQRPPLGRRVLAWPVVRSFVATQARKQVARRARPEHYPAPYAILDLFERYGASGAEAFEAEARSIARLFLSEQSRNLVRVFFLQNRMKALGGKAARKVAHVHVVGAGVMGGDIAAWCASRGLTVTLQDREMKYVEPALARAREFFGKRSRDPAKAGEMAARLAADVEGAGVPRADIVIEAIFENADAKRALYAKLEPRMKPEAILATNTSSIVLEELARGLARPGQLVGLHFFNPVAKMMLVEIIRSSGTGDDHRRGHARFHAAARQAAPALPEFARLRREPPCLMPYMTEAMLAADEGVRSALNRQCRGRLRHADGPDRARGYRGLDGRLSRRQDSSRKRSTARAARHRGVAGAGHVGRKSGRGYYEWRDGKPVKPQAEGSGPGSTSPIG